MSKRAQSRLRCRTASTSRSSTASSTQIVATILDSACGYAAFSLMPPEMAVLTVEYKINLLRPAKGNRLIARARVVRAGKTLTVCAGDAFAETDGVETGVATMLATVMAVEQRDDLRQ